MFILGRTVAGIGGAVLAPGVMLILTDVVPREKRPLYTGLLAASGGMFNPPPGFLFANSC